MLYVVSVVDGKRNFFCNKFLATAENAQCSAYTVLNTECLTNCRWLFIIPFVQKV